MMRGGISHLKQVEKTNNKAVLFFERDFQARSEILCGRNFSTRTSKFREFSKYPAVRICVGIRICVGLPYSRITVLTLTGYLVMHFFLGSSHLKISSVLVRMGDTTGPSLKNQCNFSHFVKAAAAASSYGNRYPLNKLQYSCQKRIWHINRGNLRQHSCQMFANRINGKMC